ncbi:phage antirepressor KilAC domain-containing protein [Terrisporobacter mayombei]|nr:phage antirepressor KilAC domain-containing protein [Terrisporobacter mayombei]
MIKSGDNILVRELAKIVSDEGVTIGERRLYARLREWGYICKNSTEPTQRAMNQNYFVVQVGTIKTPYGIKETKTTKVTPKGQIRIVERILEENKIEN